MPSLLHVFFAGFALAVLQVQRSSCRSLFSLAFSAATKRFHRSSISLFSSPFVGAGGGAGGLSSVLISTQANPSGASPGGECFGFFQSGSSSGVSKCAIACSMPIPAIAHRPQKIQGSTVTAVPPVLSVRDVCDAEYRQSVAPCPPAGRESPGHVVTAPPGVVQSRGTPHRARNRLTWLQIQLFLEDLPKRGGVSS